MLTIINNDRELHNKTRILLEKIHPLKKWILGLTKFQSREIQYDLLRHTYNGPALAYIEKRCSEYSPELILLTLLKLNELGMIE